MLVVDAECIGMALLFDDEGDKAILLFMESARALAESLDVNKLSGDVRVSFDILFLNPSEDQTVSVCLS